MYVNLSLLSKHRTQLMGIAMVWIVLHHYDPFLHDLGVSGKIISKILSIGYGGVDIFLFLSGLGLYYAWKKNPSLNIFYKRRFQRVLPTFITITFVGALGEVIFCNYHPAHIFTSIFFIEFFNGIFTRYTTEWYIPGILILYLISPLIFKYIIREKIAGLIMVFILIIISVIIDEYTYINQIELWPNNTLLDDLIVRFPIFILGMYLGYLMYNNIQIPISIGIIFTILAVFASIYFALNYEFVTSRAYDLWGYLYFFICPPLCMALAFLLSLFKKYKYPLLTYIGTYSLPFYLLHAKIRDILAYLTETYSNTYFLIAFIITLILAKPVQKYSEKLFKIK